MTHTCTYSNYMLVQISHRSYRAYSYSEVPVGTKVQNDTHLFTLIPSSGYYHITMGIPRPVMSKTQQNKHPKIQYNTEVS